MSPAHEPSPGLVMYPRKRLMWSVSDRKNWTGPRTSFVVMGRKANRGVYIPYNVAPAADFPACSTGLGVLETRLLSYHPRCFVHFARPPSIPWIRSSELLKVYRL